MGALRERLQQAVYGFSQLAGCVCQGALVQVRTSRASDIRGQDSIRQDVAALVFYASGAQLIDILLGWKWAISLAPLA